MIRKTTAAALVLSAIPAALAMTLFAGTAQADDTPWGKGITGDIHSSQIAGDGDTPWGTITSDDTPWGRSITLPTLPTDDDTPWG
jgi:hypothetical protein